MTGELIHTAQTQTILAGSVPQTRPEACDQTWLEAGMREQRRSGLARALFCVRLLEQGSDGSAEQRLSFLIGAFLASDVDAMVSRGLFNSEGTVVITGGGVIAEAFSGALARLSARAVILDDADVERGAVSRMPKRLLSPWRSTARVSKRSPRAPNRLLTRAVLYNCHFTKNSPSLCRGAGRLSTISVGDSRLNRRPVINRAPRW